MTRSRQLTSAAVASLLLFAAGAASASIMSGSTPGSNGLSAPSVVVDPPAVFSIDLLGNDATANLSATSLGSGEYLATGGTLDVTAGADAGIYSLVSGGPAPFSSGSFSADNVLYAETDPYLDEYGLLFAGSGGLDINIFGDSPGVYTFLSCTTVSTCNVSATGTPTSVSLDVPEPGTLALFGIGLAALAAGVIVRRRKLS